MTHSIPDTRKQQLRELYEGLSGEIDRMDKEIARATTISNWSSALLEIAHLYQERPVSVHPSKWRRLILRIQHRGAEHQPRKIPSSIPIEVLRLQGRHLRELHQLNALRHERECLVAARNLTAQC